MKRRNEKKKWLFYLLYALILFCYFIFGHKILEYIYIQKSRNYEITPYIIWSSVLYIVGGVILGLEKFLSEVKKEGRWKVNWPKVIFLEIPSLFISAILFIMFIPNVFIYQKLFSIYLFFITSNSNFIQIIQVIFGYLLITSFYKVKR